MSNPMKITGLTYQIRVSDHEADKDWYSKLIGRPPDLLPHDGFQGQAGFYEWELTP